MCPSIQGDIHSYVVSIQSENGYYSTRVVSVPNFLFICGSKVVQNGLAKGVTKVSFPSQFSSTLSLKNKYSICLSSSTSSNGVLFFGNGLHKLNNDQWCI